KRPWSHTHLIFAHSWPSRMSRPRHLAGDECPQLDADRQRSSWDSAAGLRYDDRWAANEQRAGARTGKRLYGRDVSGAWAGRRLKDRPRLGLDLASRSRPVLPVDSEFGR